MQHEPNRERLWEAIEACRPGSDDLADPGMADLAAELDRNPRLNALFQRLQKLDVAVAGAIQDVPLTPGLADRVLSAVAAQEALQAPSPDRRQPAARRRPNRARPWFVGLAGAMAAMLLVGLGLLQRSRFDENAGSVLEAAVDFFAHDAQAPGLLLSTTPPPWGFAPSRHVRLTPRTCWRRVSDLLGVGGVAYEIGVGPGAPRATLYVVRRSVAGLPDQPPASPQYGTAHCWTAAWQEGQVLYVLVVAGERRDYERLLNMPLGPLA